MSKYILFDVGANQGQDSLDRTRNDPMVEAWAFEPIPELFNRIDTARKNGYTWQFYHHFEPASTSYEDRYHVFPLAISDYDGESTFYVADRDPVGDWGASSLYPFVEQVSQTWPGRQDLITTRTVTVKVSRFDTWYRSQGLNLEKIDYFHCDTQGSDLRVLKGMGDYVGLIQEGVVECARDEAAKLYKENHTVTEMKDFLTEHGFEVLREQSNDLWSNEFNVYFKKK